MSYSVAIRTLCNSPFLETELQEIFSQTVKPEKVFIFIPKNMEIPALIVGYEEYFHVKKGMMHQRLFAYEEIKSDYLLMLDDDVALQNDSVEKLIEAIEINNADLVGVDTFQNHKLPISEKINAAISNFVFPHFSQKWAFKIHKNGSFSYINNPKKSFYPSQSCAGNAMLWKTESYRKLRMQDELWLDSLPFAYGDDMLESYKVYKNGMRLGVVFNCGIKHLDNKSASDSFRKSPDYIKNRTKAQFAIWWRTCYKPGNSSFLSQLAVACAFLLKMLWMFLLFLLLSIIKFNFSYIFNFLKGLCEGWKFVHSESFRSIPPYVIS